MTPSLPPGHEPDTEQPADVDQTIRRAVQEYAALQPELREATEQYVELVTSMLDDAGINYLTVTGRAKTVASFAAKAERTDGGQPLYRDPLHQITDQIGVRVITYVRSDVTAVADVLSDQLSVLEDRDMGEVHRERGPLRLRQQAPARRARRRPRRGRLRPPARPQRAGAGAHRAAARLGRVRARHPLQGCRSRGARARSRPPLHPRRRTARAGRQRVLGDPRPPAHRPGRDRDELDDTDPRIAANDLAAFLAAEFSDAEWSRTDHYEWISGLLLELGITSLDELAGLLGTIDVAAIDARTAYRYPPGAVRRLDDALLAVFGQRYVALHGNAHRVSLLRARLDRLRGNDSSG